MVGSFAAGYALGFAVAAEIGPIWLLCARTALRHGFWPGFGVGAGAATIDVAYAGLGVAGAAALLSLTGLRLVLGVIGAVVLLVLGARTLLAAFRPAADAAGRTMSARAGFRVAVLTTAANPLTIASWAAIFAAVAAARVTRTAPEAVALLSGVGLGSITWFTLLSGGVSLLRARVGRRVLTAVDVVSGAGLAGFGLVLLLRVLKG